MFSQGANSFSHLEFYISIVKSEMNQGWLEFIVSILTVDICTTENEGQRVTGKVQL